jgi:hypothetical protein
LQYLYNGQIFTFIGALLCVFSAGLILAWLGWWMAERLLKTLGLIATVVSYGCHRTVLRLLLLAGREAPKGCIACGHDHRYEKSVLAPMPPPMPTSNEEFRKAALKELQEVGDKLAGPLELD